MNVKREVTHMKKFNLLNILDRKFRSPDEPELDWYLGYKDSD